MRRDLYSLWCGAFDGEFNLHIYTNNICIFIDLITVKHCCKVSWEFSEKLQPNTIKNKRWLTLRIHRESQIWWNLAPRVKLQRFKTTKGIWSGATGFCKAPWIWNMKFWLFIFFCQLFLMDPKRNNAKKHTFHHQIFHMVTCKSGMKTFSSNLPRFNQWWSSFWISSSGNIRRKTFCKTTVEMIVRTQ